MSRFLFFVLPGLLSMPLLAHDLWIERDAFTHTLAYGHERSAHEGARRLDYKADTVQAAGCYDITGRELPAERGRTSPVTLKGDCAATWFLLSSGYWSKTPYGTKNLPKSEAGAVIDSWFSVEAVKRIDRWGEALARPLTRDLELVPLANPLSLKTGDKLRLCAYFQGKPAAQVTVAYFGKPRGVTSADGIINIRLQNPGFQLVQGSLEFPLDDGKANKAIHTSSLQFQIR